MKQVLQKDPYQDINFWLIATSMCLLSITTGWIIGDYSFSIGTFFTLIVGFICISIFGIFIFGAYASFFLIMGKCLGGKGGFKKLLAALIWSGIPTIYALFIGIIWLSVDTVPCLTFFKKYSLLRYTFGFWTSAILGVGLAEAHEFSIRKGLFLSLITWIGLPLLLHSLHPLGVE
jgi:hypothetical protein